MPADAVDVTPTVLSARGTRVGLIVLFLALANVLVNVAYIIVHHKKERPSSSALLVFKQEPLLEGNALP